jgi:DNA primase
MSDTVQQIKDRLSIVDVVSQYVKLDRAGSTLRARCPFHAERTPSFHVSPDRGTYHCFGCGVGGDIFSFVEAIEGVDFKGALKILADKAGVQIVYSRAEKKDDKDRLYEAMEAATIFYTSKLDDAAKKYLHDRGMEEATIKEFRLGSAGNGWSDLSDFLTSKKFTEKEMMDAGLVKKNERGNMTDKFRNRIMFPIADSAGRVVAFSGRSFGEYASPEAPKYLNSPETPLYHKSRILYGFDRAKFLIRKHNFAVLVEGQMDLLASHQAGWGNTVAVSGTAFTPEHASLLKRMTENLVIALDADQAGIKAAGRAARAALTMGLNVKVAKLPAESDPADLILKEGPEAWRTAVRESKDIITFLLDVLEEHAKSTDTLRRGVETVVLPFLSDVQSPIAREQYIHEIAARLKVSERAVAEAFAKVPRANDRPAALRVETVTPTGPDGLSRAKHAYSIYLWQNSLHTKLIDADQYRQNLETAVGPEVMKVLNDLSEMEKEELRFSAEALYAKSPNLMREVAMLLRVIELERLSRELADATLALQKAENSGDDNAQLIHMSTCKALTERIARLHVKV